MAGSASGTTIAIVMSFLSVTYCVFCCFCCLAFCSSCCSCCCGGAGGGVKYRQIQQKNKSKISVGEVMMGVAAAEVVGGAVLTGAALLYAN